MLIASLVVIGEGVVWYSSQFWALYFLQQVSKMDVVTSSYLLGLALLIAAPTLILFGWLSDLIGRKPVILSGFLLAALTYYPLYSWLGQVTQPDHVNQPAAILIIAVLVSYVGMVYGPIGAFLAEYFPAKSATRRCQSLIISAMVGAAAWCLSSPRPHSRPRAALAMR